ncbi:MAG: sigma factor-like helix-turn-helix DNA-binding protein [Planctomycetia bacterium]|nr:sigma factor-like helix-turn-helix DNA-binding protein [Planctomycetia bacterium]
MSEEFIGLPSAELIDFLHRQGCRHFHQRGKTIMDEEKQNGQEQAEDAEEVEVEAEVDEDIVAVQRIREGDYAALAEVVGRHGSAVFRIADRIVGDREDAFEVMQKAFLAVVEGDLRSADTQFSHWIYRITVNTALEVRRLHGGRGDTRVPSRGRDIKTAIDDAFRRLPENSCAALALVTAGRLSYQEASEILQTPVGTVMNRIYQSRQKLWESLASEIV